MAGLVVVIWFLAIRSIKPDSVCRIENGRREVQHKCKKKEPKVWGRKAKFKKKKYKNTSRKIPIKLVFASLYIVCCKSLLATGTDWNAHCMPSDLKWWVLNLLSRTAPRSLHHLVSQNTICFSSYRFCSLINLNRSNQSWIVLIVWLDSDQNDYSIK